MRKAPPCGRVLKRGIAAWMEHGDILGDRRIKDKDILIDHRHDLAKALI